MISFNNMLVSRAIDIDITTFEELKKAIENANDGDVLNLNIRNDLLFTSTVVISRSLTINITNGSGSNEVILSFTTGGNFRHFSTNPSGTTTLADVPDISMSIGEGVVLNGNNTSGGIGFYSSGGQLILDGCSIIDCVRSGSGATGNGGGLFIAGNTAICTLTMQEVLISNCMANNGGGIHLNSNTVCIMNNGEISGNTATADNSNGGGVYVFGATNSFTMNGGTIFNNTASNGGGVFILDGIFTMSDNVAIIYNIAGT